jgi:hypothetical protein
MFYTYLWLREDGRPYYVGKGTGDRAFRGHRHGVLSAPPLDRIILQEWLIESEAFKAEKFLIEYYGRADLKLGCLRNLTDGGEGPSNPSIITRNKIRKAMMGNSRTLGRKHSEESIRRMRVVKKIPHPWHAKLSFDQVREIRNQAVLGDSIARLARRFDLHWKSIQKILDRKSYAYVE